MIDLVELFQHWDAGRSTNELAVSLGMDRKTVRKYLAPAKTAGLSPGQNLTTQRWRELVAEWFPDIREGRLKQITWPEFDKQIHWIREQVAAGVKSATIHQRLVDEYAVTASQRSFYRWLHATLPDELAEARGRPRVSVLMPPPEPGVLGQVDYGMLGRWVDSSTGNKHRVWAFIFTLPYSKQPFVYPTIKMDQSVWSRAHILAFEFFGGTPSRIVSDNLKTGVITPDLYDPLLNEAYRELAAHYGTLIDPARSLKPKDKPHVERMVQYVRGSFWAGREFTSLQQMQSEAARWSKDVAGARSCRVLDGRKPWDVLAEEKQYLKPLPTRQLDTATWATGKVGTDCHVSIKRVLYSVPHRYVGQSLSIRVGDTRVDFYDDDMLVKTHPRIARGRQTDMSDYPEDRAWFIKHDPTWCRMQAETIGSLTVSVIGQLLEDGRVGGLRSCQRIIALTETFSKEQVENACAQALDVGDATFRTVKGLLTNNVETVPEEPGGDNGAGALLRGPTAFVTTQPSENENKSKGV